MPSKTVNSAMPVIPCDRHSHEYITNFCCDENCLLPLCPECIDEHNKFHNNSGNNLPEVDTLRRVQQMCLLKTSQ